MAFVDSSRRGMIAYIAVLIAALIIVAVGTTIWLMTDSNTGTNSLATDEKAMTRTPRLP
jgi:heme/copper-type cytochrome/quinol oxidase subunit 4